MIIFLFLGALTGFKVVNLYISNLILPRVEKTMRFYYYDVNLNLLSYLLKRGSKLLYVGLKYKTYSGFCSIYINLFQTFSFQIMFSDYMKIDIIPKYSSKMEL